MTQPTPTPEENLPAAPESADKTGFFNRVQRELKPKPQPTEEQEIVVNMKPIDENTDDEPT
jgi:hypothetical protein